ncbi:MAG: universal stress protein, partial [Aquificaceae bacterium]
SHKPTFILKGKEPEAIKRVLLAYDFSEHASKAMEFALKLLKPFSPQFIILHVEETIEIPLVEGIKDSLSERYREEKIKHLRGLEERLKKEGFQGEFYIIEGKSPADGIREFLKETPPIDLLILGSRGLSGLKRVLIGSTSSELIKSLEVPMLVHRGEG